MTSARFARFLAGAVERRFDRRGFFTRTAMAGTALAVAPTDFVLRPGTAYAAICSCQGQSCDCGSMCCSGYTEFCCTITGRNTCPPGTLLGGWWKAEGAGFCNGPRYYMDCNAGCGPCGCDGGGVCSGSCSGTGCGCANGSCDNRKAGCVQFRYGQCNQGVACLGPIVCRLVTCIPPWEIDGSCTTTARVDENTRYHDRPCLHGVSGSLEVVSVVPGGVRVAGWVIDADTSDPIDVEVLVDGAVVATVYASIPRADIAGAFPGHGPLHGFDTTVPAKGGTRQVCVQAIHRGPDAGTRSSLGCRTVTLAQPITGNLEQVQVVEPGKVRLVGWALDPDHAGPVDLHVYVDGVGRANVTADRSRPDVAAAFGTGPLRGFDVTVPVGSGRHEVCCYVVNPAQGESARLACRTVELGSPFGVVEAAIAGPGSVRLVGWALDPDTSSSIDVHVYVDGVGRANVKADRPRPDVAARYGLGSAHGFDVTVPAPSGRRSIAVFAPNAAGGGGTRLLADPSVVVGGDPIGVLEAVTVRPGVLRVSGWALDRDTIDPVDVHVYVDGVGRANIRADRARPDVGTAFPAYGPAHGFEVDVPVAPGSHEVCVFAINLASGTSSPLLGCRSAMVGGSPMGNLEAVRVEGERVRVIGWALDPDTADPVDVHVYVDGVGVANVPASAARPDIARAYPGWGEAHGIDLLVDVAPGQHEVCVYAINRGLGGTVSLGCRTVVR